jgi:hypothetical protein
MDIYQEFERPRAIGIIIWPIRRLCEMLCGLGGGALRVPSPDQE